MEMAIGSELAAFRILFITRQLFRLLIAVSFFRLFIPLQLQRECEEKFPVIKYNLTSPLLPVFPLRLQGGYGDCSEF